MLRDYNNNKTLVLQIILNVFINVISRESWFL